MKTALIIGAILFSLLFLVSCSVPAPVERSPILLSSSVTASALCGNGFFVEFSSPACLRSEEWTPYFQKFCGDSSFSEFVLVTPCVS